MMKPYKIAAKAIIFCNDQVLVLRKSKEERLAKNHHGWDFPGGGLEPDEPIMEALAREVLEETGLRVQVIGPVYIYDEVQQDRHLVIMKFACHQPEGKLILSSEHESAHWYPLTNISSSALPEWMKDEVHRAWHLYRNPPA